MRKKKKIKPIIQTIVNWNFCLFRKRRKAVWFTLSIFSGRAKTNDEKRLEKGTRRGSLSTANSHKEVSCSIMSLRTEGVEVLARLLKYRKKIPSLSNLCPTICEE